MHNVPDYHLLTERIGWRITDFDWDAIDLENVSDDDRLRLRETTLIENGIPHYTELWQAVRGFSDEWELRQFNLIWSYEELRHAESLRRLAEKIGLGLDGELRAVIETSFVETRNKSCPTGCYETIGAMLTYTTLQELVTWKFYSSWAKSTQCDFIKRLLTELAADEMRHHQWFANALQRYLPKSPDPDRYRQEICDAIGSFHMPQFFYELPFPYIEGRMAEYMNADDVAMMKAKVAKVLSFDPQVIGMLLKSPAIVQRLNLGGAAS